MPKKFIHKDGSETILKVKHYEYDETFKRKEIKKDFVTLFLSVSKGCNFGCKLCSLTYKNHNYIMLSSKEIIDNNKFICENSKYDKVKISFMGMGEGILLHNELQNIAVGITGYKFYGVDVGTMLPFVSYDLENSLNNLYNGRIFYSLHSAIQNTRNELINSQVSVNQAKEFLQNLKIRKVCHYTLIDDLNDSNEEIMKAISFCKDTNSQLRILEFNKPIKSPIIFQPSNRKNEVYKLIKDNYDNFKFCYSSGKNMKAACGMFQ